MSVSQASNLGTDACPGMAPGWSQMSHFYVTKKSPQTGEQQSTEIEEKDFPAELRQRRPDEEDALSTKLSGYAMARVRLQFQERLLGGSVVYSVISDDWRVTSWLQAA